MFFVAAEFEDIPLRDAQVFEKHPGRVREIGGLGAVEFWREVLDGVLKCRVGVAAVQKFEQMFAQGLVRIFGHGFLRGIGCRGSGEGIGAEPADSFWLAPPALRWSER